MPETLTPERKAALFDILSHYDTYAEIRDFRFPGTLKHYGPPFTSQPGEHSSSPALQALVTKYLLTLPGLRDLPDKWWKVQCHEIIESFEKSNLSESYDKGALGSRKTLASAISALIEYPVRGTFGGFAQVKDSRDTHDPTKADDVAKAFRDFMDGCIYGSVLEETVAKAPETDDLAEHSSLIRGVHEYVLVNMASFMHYTLVLSPKGQYLLKLIDNANKLVPYMLVKQTLRIGNVASMISAMVRIGLAKMSVTSVTNWIGLTSGADEGMNLVQHIVSTVLNWGIRDLESRATKIEKEKGRGRKQALTLLKEYPSWSREEQERVRKQSQHESISIITALLKDKNLEAVLDEHEHAQLLDYLAIQLSIRDRKEIIQTLCHSNPDHFTQSIREVVDAYDPVIRQMHNAINLTGTVGDMEHFIRDMIKLGRINTSDANCQPTVPTVGDFVMLLRKHQFSCHTFIHQACKNGSELTDWYLVWSKNAAAQFKRNTHPAGGDKATGALDMIAELERLFDALPPGKQKAIFPILDAQGAYLDEMHSSSRARLEAVLHSPPSKDKNIAAILSQAGSNSRPSSRAGSRSASPAPSPAPTHKNKHAATPTVTADAGPGAFLSRWQDILDHTPITPHNPGQGKVFGASSEEVVNASAKNVDGEKLAEFPGGAAVDAKAKGAGKKPDVRVVVDALASDFRTLLAAKSCNW